MPEADYVTVNWFQWIIGIVVVAILGGFSWLTSQVFGRAKHGDLTEMEDRLNEAIDRRHRENVAGREQVKEQIDRLDEKIDKIPEVIRATIRDFFEYTGRRGA